MTDENTNIIDMSKPIEAIKHKYGESCFLKNKAHQELSELWGFPFKEGKATFNHTTENLVELDTCRGSITFSQKSSKGYWLIGISAQTANSGFSNMPSVFSYIGFTSYEDARLAGILRLQKFFREKLDSKSSLVSSATRLKVSRALKILEAEKQPQLDLFPADSDAEPGGGMRGR